MHFVNLQNVNFALVTKKGKSSVENAKFAIQKNVFFMVILEKIRTWK